MAVNYAGIPSSVAGDRHWVLNKDKQPFDIYGSPKGWNLSSFWAHLDQVKKVLEANPGKYDGIGYIIARDALRKDDQIQGGDLDCCRDPITGEASPWALKILQRMNTYSEPSISGTGFRFFHYGKLPEDINEVIGNGPDDLTEEMKVHILEAKPKAREKLAKGLPVWNGFELYEDGPKHLTVTGQRLQEYPAELQHRRSEVLEIITPFLKEAKPVKATPKKSTTSGKRLPSLNILDIIDTTGFDREGDELVGPDPIIGSITGKNLKVNPANNAWCSFHDNIKKGGDPWLWLAVECGAITIDQTGSGVLKDRAILEKTLKHAVARGLITEAEAKFNSPAMERGEALLLVADLKEKATKDPGAPFEPKYIEALAVITKCDLPEYERTIASLKGKASVRDLKKKVTAKALDIAQQSAKAEEDSKKAVPADIKQAAKDIIERGSAYEYIYGVWQKRVKGNQWLGKALLISRGVQSCLNTKGIHVYAHGKHGHGKSEGMEKMAELTPSAHMMDEDVSPLAVYYASEEGLLLPGTTLLIDEMIWTDSLGGMCKRITTRFQRGASHLTVIDGKPRRFRTKERIAIWTNSADMQADEQLRDRFFDVPVDENQTKDIIEFQKKRDTLPDMPEEIERETAICREILRDLTSKTFLVKIPFAERVRIKTSEGTRGYNIFSDLIKGLAALRYAQRQINEKGQLLAAIEDFDDAKAIYEGVKGHSEERYGSAEEKILQAIIDNGYKALIKDIKDSTGLSEGRIKDIINGRGKDEQKRHGLLYKCSQLEANRVDISININADERRTIHPFEYSLPKGFKLSSNGKNLITLDPDVCDVDPDVPSDVLETNNSKDGDVVDVAKEGREEDITKDVSFEENNPKLNFIPPVAKHTSTTSRSQEIAKDADVPTTSQYVAMAEDSEKALRHGAEAKEQSNEDTIRIAARQEYGINGWVDPRKIASNLKLPESEVMAWLDANYKRYERAGGGIGYRQKSWKPSEANA